MSNFICDGQVIRDEYGRHRMFRGINVVIKSRELSPEKFKKLYCNEEFFKTMESNGFNIIRLGLVWDLIEAVEGKYENDYIDAYKEFVNICKAKGIYIMLDMHQDLYSAYLGGGDGAPLWVVKDKYTLNQKPYAIWAEGYFYMDSVQQAFYDFWHNTDYVQDKFIKMWSYFASQFSDCSNVIAYDYLNEPYIDKNGRTVFLTVIKRVVKKTLDKNINPERFFEKYNNKKAFLKSVFEIATKVKTLNRLKKVEDVMDNFDNFAQVIGGLEKYTTDFNHNCYEPFIQKVSQEVNPTLSRFNVIEHNYYSNLGIPFDIKPPKNCLYSPHAYDIFVDSPMYNKYSSNERISFIISKIKENQDRMNIPVLFGEWGAGANGNEWVKHIDYILGLMDDNLWSNIYWAYNDKKLHDTINRPYPVAFNGTIKKIKTNSKDRTFYLEWEQGTTVEPNLLYMPNKGLIKVEGKVGLNTYKITY